MSAMDDAVQIGGRPNDLEMRPEDSSHRVSAAAHLDRLPIAAFHRQILALSRRTRCGNERAIF
jgi:hypothetical protein